MAHTKQGAVAFYIIIALILGAITYVEFAIIQYEQSFAWLSPTWKVITLTVLSLAKFVLVIAIYMHLRDDDPMYTGFFTSGLIIALGTFIALSFLFTARSMANLRSRAEAETAVHGEPVTIPTERALVESLRAPQPKDQTFQVEPPAAPAPSFSLPVLGLSVPDAVNPEAVTDTEAVADTETGETEAGDTEAGETVAEEPAGTSSEPESVSEPAAEATATEASEAANSGEGSSEPSAETDAEAASETTDPTDATSSDSAAAVLAQAADFDWKTLGETTYRANCTACHQTTGQGISGAFPPLAGHIPGLYNAAEGRQYIINVVLYGLQGALRVKDADYNGVMPGWPQLSDDQLAATLNHELNSWGNDALLLDFRPILPEEVAAERGKDMTSAKVLELRPALP
jgi:mono/diheme cytochrome c family protein